MFFVPRGGSSTSPRPNSLDAIASAWPRSWLISSVITESLKWLLIAAKGAAPEPEPHNSEDAAAPPRAVRKLRRDGNTSMQYPLPRHGRSRCADGITSLCRGHLSLAFSWKASALFPSTPSERSRPAADAAREANGAVVAYWVEISCGSQGGPCDPFTQNDAGGTPAS